MMLIMELAHLAIMDTNYKLLTAYWLEKEIKIAKNLMIKTNACNVMLDLYQ